MFTFQHFHYLPSVDTFAETLDHLVCSIYFSNQAIKCPSAKASNGITRVHITIKKYLSNILDTLFRIPVAMQVKPH